MNSFKEVVSQNSDEKLIEILSNRNKYKNIVVDVAIKESIVR